VVTVKTSGGWAAEGNADREDGTEGCVMRLIGLFDGDETNRGVLKLFQ
jgi:hypothetical protein